MCNRSCIAFGERSLTPELVRGRDVLEVGAQDVNGSLRSLVESMEPARYVGVDLTDGPGVDEVVNAGDLIERFGRESFDLVITTEMVEHTRDWRTVVTNLKGVLRPGGHLLLTTRSRGFAYHAWPHDYWRYEPGDMSVIFGDLEMLSLEPDPEAAGVFVLARRPDSFVERTLDVALFSIVTGRRDLAISDHQVERFLFRYRLLRPVREARAQLDRARSRGRRLSRGLRRSRNAVWQSLPLALRSTVKRTLGRT